MLELAIVVPTFNERANVSLLLDRLHAVLGSRIDYEVIFVDDDSPDGTAAQVRRTALRNPRVRVLQRVGRRGLSSACLEGMLATPAPYIAVMDADLQHDESILPEMFRVLTANKLDIVVASRNTAGGSMGGFSKSRVWLSQMGRKLSGAVLRCELSDPMSGFFVMDRRFLEEVVYSVSGVGFKILLDIVSSAPRPVRAAEVPYTFGARLHGESKLDILVGVEYLTLLLEKLIGDVVPTRYVMFGLVGSLGVIAYMLLLTLFYRVLSIGFVPAQIITAVIVMTLNFFLNNSFTYRDRKLRGVHLITGLLSFCAACSIGGLANVRVAQFLMDVGVSWYFAGITGLVTGSVWNYGITSLFTWRWQKRRSRARTIQAAAAAHAAG